MLRVFSCSHVARFLALTVLFVHFASASWSQTVQEAPWFSRQIGTGVEWKHYQFENLYGNRQSVSLIIADLSVAGVNVRIPYLASSRQRISSMIPAQFPTAVGGVNGSFFDTSSGGGGSTTFLRINNAIITNNDNTGEALKGAVTISSIDFVRIQPRPTSGWESITTRRDILAQGPLLIYNFIRTAEATSFCTARHPRTFVGKTRDNKIILATVDGRTPQSAGMTCTDMESLMLDLGCDDATNMDGGGSSTMWVAGEANNGVVNYPSDNGRYDHLGERSVSNGIAILANPAPPALIDARLLSASYSRGMIEETAQLVTLRYENIGQTSWTPETVSLNVTRPRTRQSTFYDDSWVSATAPARLEDTSVLPGGTGTFRFIVRAPDVQNTVTFGETFGLVHETLGIFGPADNEPRLEFLVSPPSVPTTDQVIIESREGGKNFSLYQETVGAWADVATNCTAPGLTPGIGQRYASSYRSVAGAKHAVYTPNFATTGVYDVEIAYGDGGGLARNGISYKVVHAGGSQTVLVNQTVNKNVWVSLGRFTFSAGTGGYIEVSNDSIDVSGNMYSAAARFTPVPAAVVGEWNLY